MKKLLILSATAIASAFAFGKTLLVDNFRFYPDHPTAFADDEGVIANQDGVWDFWAELNCKATKDMLLLKQDLSLPKDGAKGEFTFAFNSEGQKYDNKKKELTEKGKLATFDLVFKDASGKESRVTITPEKFGSLAREFVLNGKETRLAFVLKGTDLEILTSPARHDLKALGHEKLPFAPVSFNLGLKAQQQISFRFVRVTTAEEAFTAFPVEKHFADFRSLTQKIEGGKVAAGTEKIEIKSGCTDVKFRLNATNGVVKVFGYNKDGKETWKGSFSPSANDDSIFSVPFGEHCVKPSQSGYAAMGDCGASGHVPQWWDIKREWDRLPKATEHVWTLRIDRACEACWKLSLDGSSRLTLCADSRMKPENVPVRFVIEPGAGVSYAVARDVLKGVDTSRFEVVELGASPKAKAMADGQLKGVKPGLKTVGGAPVRIVKPMDSADVAICKYGKGNWALEVEQYLSRQPHWGYPSEIHFKIPAAFYHTAHVVFALDPDEKKDKILTVRLGMFSNSGANRCGDAVVDFTKGLPKDLQKVGEVVVKGKTLPLYYMAVPLKLGEVMDFAQSGTIDFEFIGKKWTTTQQLDYSAKPDPSSDSAFNVFAVTLEKAPYRAVVVQDPKAPGNVWAANESDRKTTMRLVSTKDGKGTVAWTAKDFDGNVVREGKKEWMATGANVTNDVVASFDGLKQGFYTLDWSFLDSEGKTLFTHHAAAGITPEIGRKVSRKESPYTVWWFGWNHGSVAHNHIGGPLMQKAGIRKSTWYSPAERSELDKYDIAPGGVLYGPWRPWGAMKLSEDEKTATFNPDKEWEYVVPGSETVDPVTKKKSVKKEKTKNVDLYMLMALSNTLANVKNADITKPHLLYWHESAPGSGTPEELLGLPVPEGLAYGGALYDAIWLNKLAEILHKNFPGVELQIGNSTHSTGAVKGPMRAGAKPETYDRVGIETPAQTVMPERLIDCGFQGQQIPLDTAEAITGKRIKANGAWEFIYRTSRDLGELKQAEWYMRDILIALAHDYFMIAPGVFFDCQTGYYDGLWGGAGLTYRAPWVYPKPAYVAYAVITKAMDGAKLSRQFDTGSTTVYAIEYKRCDGLYATALWCAKGAVDFKVTAENGFLGMGGGGTVVRMLGAEEDLPAGESIVKGGTSPCYLITKKPLKSVSIAGRSYPREDAIAAKAKVASKLDSLKDVVVKPDPAYTARHHKFLPYLQPCDDFEAKEVVDEERGKCIELTLKPAKEKPVNKFVDRYVTRFTTLTFKEPKLIPGNPAVIGVWVKGDSNWGQIRFEIEDAKGQVFRNLSTGSWWICDIMDWPGNLAVNFDGWSYVCCSLRENKLIREVSPGLPQEQWSSGSTGDKTIHYPIKVRSITVGANRSKLDIYDFKPAAGVFRFSDVGGTEE